VPSDFPVLLFDRDHFAVHAEDEEQL